MDDKATKRLFNEISRLLYAARTADIEPLPRYALHRIAAIASDPPGPTPPTRGAAAFAADNAGARLFHRGMPATLRSRSGRAVLNTGAEDETLSRRAEVEVNPTERHRCTVRDGEREWRLSAYAPMDLAAHGVDGGAALAAAAFCDCECGCALLLADGVPAELGADTFNEIDSGECEPPFEIKPARSGAFEPFEFDVAQVGRTSAAVVDRAGRRHTMEILQPLPCK